MHEDERDEPEDEVEAQEDSPEAPGRSSAGTFAMGVAVGALLGAAIALLLAPASGQVTRKRLRHRLAEVRDKAQEEWSDLSRKASREIRKRMESVS